MRISPRNIDYVSRAMMCVLALCAFGAKLSAEVPDIVSLIDTHLLKKMEEQGLQPSAAASDAEFLRRITLDLAGGIPSVAEARDYLGSDAPNKREELIQRLLSSPATINHLAETWRKSMLPAGSPDQPDNSAGLHNWLRRQFSDNMRYDRIVSDLIAATGSQDDGPALFYTALELEPKKVAAATARIFLGLQIECAECHDHPFDNWKQEEFWGYAAFFARLPKNDTMTPNAGLRLVDRLDGEVTLPESDEVVLPKYPGGRKADPGEPGTRRQQLSIWMASPENPYLARAAVNRVWAMLFGRGLVNPVDDLGPHNPASHPELLEDLTNYFVETDYDLRNLLQVLCSTQAYGRTSEINPSAKPPVDLFAAMAVKVQTAEQLYDSLSRCLTQNDDQQFRPGVFVNGRRQQFLSRMASRSVESTEYDRGLQQALLLMNGSETAEATDLNSSALLMSLEAPFLTDEQRIETLYLATLTRYPTAAEVQRIAEFMRVVTEDLQDSGESDNPNDNVLRARKEAQADVLWALLNSAEFTMNR